ncbi:hypothetical protein [Sporosarcina sp. FSL W7-1283]|uniref:hypothetical protein n=1 Tax=Sporosarcina sp. FSL W7-1283 TaxID=2921560 RepID=UPI0030F8A1B7
MAKIELYAKLEVSPSSGYLSVTEIFPSNDIKKEYNYSIERTRKFGFTNKVESLEGYTLQYVLLSVYYDGRKKSVHDADILKSLESHGLAKKVGESMFGGFYLPTNELESMLEIQLKQRKDLIEKGLFQVV